MLIDSFQPQARVSVKSGTILGGSGTAGTITIASQTVNPGASPGILRSGGVTFDSSATFFVEMNGLLPGTD